MSDSSDENDDIDKETSAAEQKDAASHNDDESCIPEHGHQSKYDHSIENSKQDDEQNSGTQDVDEITLSQDSPSHQLRMKKKKRKRCKRQIEIKVRPDGIIPMRGKKVRDVTDAFYANRRTKDNAKKVGKQLDQRRNGMSLNHIGENSISYIMDCQSLEALESLMGDYSSGSLHRMVKSTFLSESLLDEIGALYLSLETSIDYEEYLLCQEELADIEDEEIYPQSIEAIEEMNEKMESDIKGMKASVTIGLASTRQKARDRDILRGMSVEQERDRKSELDELMNEWIKIQTELKQLNASHSELVFDRQDFTKNTGAIIDEVDIPLEIKQELMVAFQKFLPFGPDKSRKPDQKLVIEGDVLMEYVENIVHDFDIPTKRKQDVIEGFRKLVKAKSGKTTAKASLTAKQDSLQERIQAIVDDADIPDEQKEIYQQLRQVETGTPLSNTVRVLLSKDGKKSSGEVFRPYGLTINQNGHVVVCDYGRSEPGSVKTVTADTAQILTSVTVHGLPHNFTPRDTKMADNGDYTQRISATNAL
ncbi:uncharacterized protein [Ptychodera flava]|uniref:uncharacterized protein n=1 Tax=Ptychodera flava TaxID=63121 RepID=UPI00396A00E9